MSRYHSPLSMKYCDNAISSSRPLIAPPLVRTVDPIVTQRNRNAFTAIMARVTSSGCAAFQKRMRSRAAGRELLMQSTQCEPTSTCVRHWLQAGRPQRVQCRPVAVSGCLVQYSRIGGGNDISEAQPRVSYCWSALAEVKIS